MEKVQTCCNRSSLRYTAGTVREKHRKEIQKEYR
jgi:hypothetical protein